MVAERSNESRRASLRLYMALAVVAACALSLWVLHVWGPPAWPQVAFFYVLQILGLTTSVEVPIAALTADTKPSRAVTLSPGFIVLLTAVYSARPSTVVIVALVPCVAISELRIHADVLRIGFNAGQETLSFAAAAVVFTGLRPHFGSFGLLCAAAAASVVAEVLNTVLVAGAVALDRRMSVADAIRRMAWTIPHSLTFAVAALLVSTLYKHFGPAAAVFLFMPFIALRFVRQAKLVLDKAHDASIREFVRAVEFKDPYTRMHSERVAEIVVAIHRELGTPERGLSDRYLAALLHDVGKIVVPSEVLTKPGPLTTAEYDQVKRHVVVGADVVRKIDLLSHLADEVLLHHERWDGGGYPYGLQGHEIPHDVRILSVADCFEAMTSERVYRRALTVSAAVAELRRIGGSQLDPVPVEALIRVLESGIVFAKTGGVGVLADTQHAVGEQ